MSRWSWVVLLLASPALGRDDISGRGDRNLQLLGWTADGRYFVWTANDPVGVDGEDHPYWARFEVSTRTIRRTPGDVTEWQKTHPLAPRVSGREGPGGLKAEIVVTNGSRGGSWNKQGTRWEPGGTSGWELRVVRDGKSRTSIGTHASSDSVMPYWSPDKRRVAWVEREFGNDQSDEDPGTSLTVSSAGLPRVHLLGNKALLEAVAPNLSAALEQQNLIATYAGKALKQRTNSVVYAQPGFEAEAKKAARLVPGGATIEKLDWLADAELVIALGSSAGEHR